MTTDAANQSPIEGLISRLTPAEIVELRTKLGPLCLWCGAEASLLCDGQLGPLREGLTCDAPLCPQHAESLHLTGCSLPGGDGTIDTCPACVERKANREQRDRRTPEAHRVYVAEHASRVVGSTP